MLDIEHFRNLDKDVTSTEYALTTLVELQSLGSDLHTPHISVERNMQTNMVYALNQPCYVIKLYSCSC